jgi:Tfp pilus assembly protein FimT
MVRPLVPREPLWFTLYLLLLVLLCAVMFILAVVDGFAASLRLRRVRSETESLQSKLEKELEAAQDRADQTTNSPTDP